MSEPRNAPPMQKISWKTAAGLVIANMVGTGVFTSLGYQLTDVQNTWSILLLWVIGGGLALIGALIYAELGTHFIESGGDYIFLSRIFHPFAGYLYAWVSLTVGFTAPIAISAMAMTAYLSPIHESLFTDWFGITVILILTAIHTVSLGQSSRFQNASTLLKLAFVLLLIGLGFAYTPIAGNALEWSSAWQGEILLPGFAVALIYVTYAYTGWNAAAYIVEEIDDPRRHLPRALIGATVLVTLLYVLLQVVMLRQASADQLSGKVEVATIAFHNLFPQASVWVSVCIALQLLATISGYLWVGSRIIYAMSTEHALWSFLYHKNRNGIPTRALWMQAGISILLTLTGSFELVLLYASFTLQLMGTLTVSSIFWLKRKPGTFQAPARYLLAGIFILFSVWVLGFMLWERPTESLIGLGLVGLGGLSYFVRPGK